MKIAVDAMGGDFAPQNIVEGAVLAAREYGIPVVLVGDRKAVEGEIARHPGAGRRLATRRNPLHGPGRVLPQRLRQSAAGDRGATPGHVRYQHDFHVVTAGGGRRTPCSARVRLRR